MWQQATQFGQVQVIQQMPPQPQVFATNEPGKFIMINPMMNQMNQPQGGFIPSIPAQAVYSAQNGKPI